MFGILPFAVAAAPFVGASVLLHQAASLPKVVAHGEMARSAMDRFIDGPLVSARADDARTTGRHLAQAV